MPKCDVNTVEGRRELRETCKQESKGYFFEKGERFIQILQALPQALDRIEELEARVKKHRAGAKKNCQGIERLKKENQRLRGIIREQNKDQMRLLNETGKGLWA